MLYIGNKTNASTLMMAMFVSHLQCFSTEEVLSGADMTPEATFAKLSYILGQQNLSQTQRKEVSMVLFSEGV